ncbi:hypothetical protein ANO14919_025140 [Xylariales sp. No.14919]|nr:hypothetical protein ANO14919_025140 [Xylariales sp. No.14919]
MYLSSILASRGPSQLIIPAYHNIVDPEAVFVEDSDDDGGERDTRESITGPLGSFRSKLIRRISHRADSKASFRPSVGTSDEELARRAELKRLMHKRIQEELKSEEEEEEENDPAFSPPKPPSINNYREPELPRGGPRDTIEFSVSTIDNQEAGKELGTSPEMSLLPTRLVAEPQESCQRRSNCSDLTRRSIDNPYHECSVSLDEIGSVTPPPSPSRLTPVHFLGGSGRESPSTASWRLSYSAIHIESYIEPLIEARQVSRPQSPEPEPESSYSKHEDDTTHPHETDTTTNYSNPTMQNETIDTSQTMQFDQGANTERNPEQDDISSDSVETGNGRCSPLDVWLRSQDLDCVSISPNVEIELQRPCSLKVKDQAESRHNPQNCADLSGYTDQTANLSSIIQDHNSGTCPISLKHIVSNESSSSNQVPNQIGNAVPTEASHMEDQAQDISSRYTSSQYTTRPNSQQTTPRGSRLSLAELLKSRRAVQPLPPAHGSVGPYRVTTSDNSDISSYRTALNKTPSSDHAKPNPEVSQFTRTEALSVNASETASFRQREEELKSVKKRFGLTPAQRYPMTPMRSKFREEFEDPKGLNNGRSSILSKFYFAFPKRSRTSSSHTELDGSNEEIRTYSTGCRKPNKDGCHPHNTVTETPMEERTTGVRQHAKKEESDHHAGRLKAKFIKAPAPKENTNSTRAQSVPLRNHCLGIHKSHSPDEARTDPADNSFPNEPSNEIEILNEARPKNTIGIHAGVLQEWVEQLRAEDVQRRSRTESRINVPKGQPRLRTPPDSWAKWPSHTREGRTASAGKKDKVKTRDFAVVTNPGPSKTGTGSKTLSTGRELTATSRNLSSQVSKALKSSWNKMITTTGSIGRASDHELATQSTQKPHGFLEYPELELLPTAEGYREVQALDQQIDNMKRRSTSGTRAMKRSSGDSARRPLASRIAEEVHKFQTESKDIAWTDVQYHSGVPSTTHFLSPSHALLARNSKPFHPELYSAPELQCAYEDCVQTQLLDDGDDNSTTEGQHKTTIKRARSTGNIEIKLPVDEGAPTDHGLAYKARKTGLRRHKSLGWIRGRGGVQPKATASR